MLSQPLSTHLKLRSLKIISFSAEEAMGCREQQHNEGTNANSPRWVLRIGSLVAEGSAIGIHSHISQLSHI